MLLGVSIILALYLSLHSVVSVILYRNTKHLHSALRWWFSASCPLLFLFLMVFNMWLFDTLFHQLLSSYNDNSGFNPGLLFFATTPVAYCGVVIWYKMFLIINKKHSVSGPIG